MKPEVAFPDPEDAIIRYLTGRWQGVDGAPATISNSFPRSALTGDTTHLQVEFDGTPSAIDYPVTERCTVRFTAWSGPDDQGPAKELATRTQAYVYAHPGDADVWSTRHLTGRVKGFDRDSGNNFVSFTARVNLRPTAL